MKKMPPELSQITSIKDPSVCGGPGGRAREARVKTIRKHVILHVSNLNTGLA
jgi:hypothetical protein